MVSLIAAAVVGLGGSVTWAVNTWTDFGWVTKSAYQESLETGSIALQGHLVQFETQRLEYLSIEDRVETLEAAGDELGDRLKGYTQIAQTLRDLFRAQCMGATNLGAQIDAVMAEYQQLTGDAYRVPTCEELNVRD